MSLTLSEKLFEQYCAAHRITATRVPTTGAKTPDYDLDIDGYPLVAEVKEIARNKEERESDAQLDKLGYGKATGGAPGARVRKKVLDSNGQLRIRCRGMLPGLLVLFDHSTSGHHTDAYNVKIAMYGLEQVYLAVPNDPALHPYLTGSGFGPRRATTCDHNTSISAIGVLRVTRDGLSITVYHNRHAAAPLDASAVERLGATQFAIEETESGEIAKWLKVAKTT
jgi:hypothetical protein